MAVFLDIMIQTGYYAIVMIMGVGIISLLLRGFFWKYVKVRLSFGKYVMVKLRSPLRDFFSVGWVEDGFLIFKKKKQEVRIVIDRDQDYFYRTLGVNWIDVDEEKGAPVKFNFEGVVGHDIEKEASLYVRALTRISVADNKERIILIVIILAAIFGLVAVLLTYANYSLLKDIITQIPNLKVGVV